MSYFPSASYFPTAATSFPSTVAPTVFGSSQFFGSSFGAPSYFSGFSGAPTVFGAQVPTTVAPSVVPSATTAATLAAATKSGATVVAPTLPNPVFTASAGTGLPASYPAALYASTTPSSFFSSPVGYGPAPVLSGPTAASYLGQTLAAPITFGGATQYTNAQNTYLAPTNFGASPAFNMIGLGSVIGPRIPMRADQVVRRRSLSY